MFFRHKIERDPEVSLLVRNVQAQLANIAQTNEPTDAQSVTQDIRFVSFEEALKELVSLKKSS